VTGGSKNGNLSVEKKKTGKEKKGLDVWRNCTFQLCYGRRKKTL
jgi:hypothetical protein